MISTSSPPLGPREVPVGVDDGASSNGALRRGFAFVLWLLLVVCLVSFIVANSTWFLPFLRDFAHWIIHPHVAGGPTLPARWPEGLLVFVLTGVVGYQLATVALSTTPLRGDRAARCGLALVVGPCVLGLLAVLAEVTGLLYEGVLFVALVAVLALTTLLWRRVSVPGTVALRARPERRFDRADLALWTVAVAVVTFTFIHVAMSPVTEWDAIVYHASVGKLWFLGRPHPALLYGPSVGIEISDNYPPLFPATGAFFYVVLNHFDDFYLRVIPPIILFGTLLLSYGYAGLRYGRAAARWTVLLLLGCPLLVMYGAWPTGYVYLTALTTAAIILIDFAIASQGVRLWCGAGLVTGLACLTHFFGLIVVAIGLLSFVVFRRWRSRHDLKSAAVFLGSTLVVVGPWYLRNALLLGDPLYPLLAPPLPAKGLTQPIWNDSQAEIRNNALGQWRPTPGTHVGLGLRLQELGTALFNRNLLPVGILLALVVGYWFARRGDRRSLFLALSVTLLIGVQLAPGWYWWRALVPAMPIAAVLAARAVVLMRDALRQPSTSPRARARGLRRIYAVPFVALAVVAASSGLAVSIIGPDNPTWATGLNSSENTMQSVDDLGSTPATLNYVFEGGYQSWEWLNHHLGAHGRVATLDVRNYYFHRPSELFYLDGTEATPLLRLRRPGSIVAFLRRADVRYVYAPAWAVQSGPAQQPLERRLALISLLGTRDFPLVADFAVGGYNLPDAVYRVGAAPSSRPTPTASLALYQGPRLGAPTTPLGTSAYELPANDTSLRLFVTPRATQAELSFQYRQSGTGSFSVNQYDLATKHWSDGVFASQQVGASRWTRAVIPLLGVTPDHVIDLGLFAGSQPVSLRDLRVRPITQPLLGSDGAIVSGDSTITIAAQSTSARLYLPSRAAEVSSFLYHATATQLVSLNAYDARHGRWVDGVFSFQTLAGAGWEKVTLPPGITLDGHTEFGIFAPTSTIEIRGATSTPLTGPALTGPGITSASGEVDLGAGQTEFVVAPAPTSNGPSTETIAITSATAGTVTIASTGTPRGVPPIDLPVTFTGPQVRDVELPSLTNGLGIDQYSLTPTMPITIASATPRDTSSILDGSLGASASTAVTTLLPQRTDSRLFVDSRAGDAVHVTFQYETPSDGALEINQDARGSWRGVTTLGATNGVWRSASFQVRGTRGYSEFGFFAPSEAVQLRDVVTAVTP